MPPKRPAAKQPARRSTRVSKRKFQLSTREATPSRDPLKKQARKEAPIRLQEENPHLETPYTDTAEVDTKVPKTPHPQPLSVRSLFSGHTEDMDEQTRRFLQEAMGKEPRITADYVPEAVKHPRGSPKNEAEIKPFCFPGHLLSPTTYKRSWLSGWLDQNWYDHIPPGFVRMKDFKQSDRTAAPHLAITAIILAGQALIGRLLHCGLVSQAAVSNTIGRLCDEGYGQNGSLRAKFALESLIQEIHSCVLDGRVEDIDLSRKHPPSPILETICCRSNGFSPPPPPPQSASASRATQRWTNNSQNWWYRRDKGWRWREEDTWEGYRSWYKGGNKAQKQEKEQKEKNE